MNTGSKYSSGENAGKYFGLEFAYLQELSTLDMYLREQILSMTLDIEHYINFWQADCRTQSKGNGEVQA